MDVNWDLTMQKVVPFIDGINSVRRISELADADYILTKKAISHLLYYGCLTLVDVFTFSAMYAVTAEIGSLLMDHQMPEECLNYIRSSPGTGELKFVDVFELYCSLNHGVTVKKWCMEHYQKLRGIDVRRFIGFGIVKGLIYRVHKYPVASRTELMQEGLPLAKYLRGGSSFDEICTELQVGEKEVIKMLEGWDVQIVYR
jgi:hypothetical protein